MAFWCIHIRDLSSRCVPYPCKITIYTLTTCLRDIVRVHYDVQYVYE